MTSTPITAAVILAGLGCGRSGCVCVRSLKAGHGLVHCPAHDDPDPSLNVSEQQSRVLVRCHAGCEQGAVIEALKRIGLWEVGQQRPEEVRYRFTFERNGAGPLYHVRIEPPGKRKIMWWEQPDGTRRLPEGVQIEDLPLYRAGDVDARPGEPVLVLEGEKKADAAAALGFVAVSLGGGASQQRFGKALLPLRDRDVVLLPDNDLPGRELMSRIAGHLGGVAASVRTVALPNLPPKGDLCDYLAAGGTAEGLRALLAAEPEAEPTGPRLPKPKKARDLQVAGLPEIGFAVGGILPEGVTLCAGRPKQGKSFLALNLAIAVAAGGKALGDLPVQQGDVLYLTLEGGEHGFLPRLNTMLAGELAPDALEYETEWPRLDDGGTDLIAAWLTEHPAAKLVVIDTLAKVRTPTNNKSGIYEQDYAAVQSLVQLALRAHVAILLIHHTRKAVADDPLDTVSGSTGLTGAVDAVWILQRVRGQPSATLTVSGRSMPDDDLGLEWDSQFCVWRHAGTAEEVRRSQERQIILDVLGNKADGVMTAREVADLLDLEWEAVRKTMWRMMHSGELSRVGKDGYRLSSTSNEVSRLSRQSPESLVSRESRNASSRKGETGQADRDSTPNGTDGTRDFRAHEEPAEPPCPRCGFELREGYCYACRQRTADG